MEFLGQILGAAIVLAGGVAATVCLFAVLQLLLPGTLGPIRHRLDRGLTIPFLAGLGVLIVFGGAWVAIMASFDVGNVPQALQIPLGVLLGVVSAVIAGLAILTIYGLAALATLLGRRRGEGRRPFSDDLSGGLLLILSCLAPFAGWFLFTPFAICSSLGATLLALFRRNPGPRVDKSA